MHAPAFTIEKWVRVMAGHCCGGVWHRDGSDGCASALPICPALRERLIAWADRYNACGDHLPPERQAAFDLKEFSADGLKIARAIRAELPGWTIVYFDAAKCDYGNREQPRHEFEYEV